METEAVVGMILALLGGVEMRMALSRLSARVESIQTRLGILEQQVPLKKAEGYGQS